MSMRTVIPFEDPAREALDWLGGVLVWEAWLDDLRSSNRFDRPAPAAATSDTAA